MKAPAAVLVLAAVLAATATASAYPTRPGTIWTIAGNGTSCFPATDPCGDGPNALFASLNLPRGVAVDPAGNVFVVDTSGLKIRKVAPSGAISTIAGSGLACNDPTTACGDGGPATAARMNNPAELAIDKAGNLYVADQNDNKIRKVSTDGTMSTVAGNGTQCAAPTNSCGDGGAATSAQLRAPTGVAVDGSGNLYIADQFDNRIRKVAGGTITTLAGDGTVCSTLSCGDGPTPTAAQLSFPFGVAVDPGGNVYIADRGDQKIRKVAAGGGISTIAGDGTACASPTSACGDGGSPTSAQLNFPAAVAVDGAGNVYVGDQLNHKVRVVTSAGGITTVAGTGATCAAVPFCGDGGAGRDADLNNPFQVAVDSAGANIFIADANDRLIRWIAGPQGGPAGPQGPAGGTGAPGSNGATGPQGKPGRNARVTCKAGRVRKRKVRVICRVKLVRSTASAAVGARLSRHGVTYAIGHGTARAGHASLSMHRIRRITRGTYTLSTRVKGRAGVTRQRVVMR